jgi:hypothetical protein
MPDYLEDGYLLRMFGFRRTLDEIDEIDLGRHMRAMDALSYAEAWDAEMNRRGKVKLVHGKPVKKMGKQRERYLELKLLLARPPDDSD